MVARRLRRARSRLELGQDYKIHDAVNQSRHKDHDGYDGHQGIPGFLWGCKVLVGCICFVGWHIVCFVF
jgi:hypothetical protein